MAGPTVYFARVGRDGPIKIGYTAGEPGDRIADLQTGCPWPIALMGHLAGSTQNEARLHIRFAALRLEGEWFEPTTELVTAIDEMLTAGFVWPIGFDEAKRILPLDPTIRDIIWAAGGPAKISAVSQGAITADAVHKWPRNGIRDWHWALLMSLVDVTPDQLFKANSAAQAGATRLRVA